MNIIYSTTDNSPSNLIYTAKQSSFNSTGSNTSNKEKLNEEDKDKSKVKERDKYKERDKDKDKDKDKEMERERERERDKDRERDKEKECKDSNSCSSSCSSVSSRTSGTANQKKDRDSGYFTFIISNSTFEKIDVEDIKKSFLRTKSFGGYQPDEPSPTRRGESLSMTNHAIVFIDMP